MANDKDPVSEEEEFFEADEDLPPMTNHWKDIDPNFTDRLQWEWTDKGFSYEQVKEWIDIGLTPYDSDFVYWLSEEGYTALAVLNDGDNEQLRKDYQNSLIKKPLLEWYNSSQITLSQFSYLVNHLGSPQDDYYSQREIKELLKRIPVPPSTRSLTKLILVLAGIGLILYLLTN